MNLINKANIFGIAKCYMFTVEWQKRGLPHIHLLLWLQEKIRPDQIDSVISAEIPDKRIDPGLHDLVLRHMIHGPCGTLNRTSPCMNEGKCCRKYPKHFQRTTSTGDDAYPRYRRRTNDEGGFTAIIPNTRIEVDNRWVVSYNPVLLKAFDAHINVELCSSVKSIQYVCKYINKGTDQAVFCINARNEIDQFLSGRYISTSEAVWRLLSFSIHERAPAITHLTVHLENGQRVYFTNENAHDVIENPRDTTLTAFFKLCAGDFFAKTLTYDQVPSYYTWNRSKFHRRKIGIPVEGHPGIVKSNTLGRIYVVHPTNVECYYLRILLHVVQGPTSFQDLRTVNGRIYSSYQAACKALGLIEDDTHWKNTLEEAALSVSASILRHLFATMMVFCHVADPHELWLSNRENMSQDILCKIRTELSLENLEYNDEIFNLALLELNINVRSLSEKNITDFGLPLPASYNRSQICTAYVRETTYDLTSLTETITRDEPNLNNEQTVVYNEILSSVRIGAGNIYFLDAPGGTGKTFLTNLILAKLRFEGSIALAVASSGIAATLLQGGRTAHATFKLPLNINDNENAVCNISKQSSTSKLIQKCALIVWDEATMSHKKSIEALDRTLKDLRSNNRHMGGITVLFAGDFRQTLPVVPRGTRADEVNACLKRSYLWPHIKQIALKTNMRVLRSTANYVYQFADTLLKLGNGDLPEHECKIALTDQQLCKVVSNIKELIGSIYPEIINIHQKSLAWFRERAILAPKNEAVNIINDLVLDELEASCHVYKSIDTVVNTQDSVHYPVEFLNSLNPPGLPIHNLRLKIGAPIILLRNLNPPKLCNGIRLQIIALRNYTIEAKIITGCGTGETVLIPRIPMIPSDLPFQFKRLQFPIRVCFAMSINKAQGQTLEFAGIALSEECFSHGQLYVACSRVSSNRNLYVLPSSPLARTTNLVYKEVLQEWVPP